MNEVTDVDSKIRILHVIGGLVGGGAEAQLKLLLKGIDKSLYTVGVVFINDDLSFHDRDRISFYKIERSGRLDFLSVYRSIVLAVEDFQPQMMHLWYPEVLTIPAAVVAKKRGIGIISTQRHRLGGSVALSNKIRDLVGSLAHLLSHQIITNFDVSCEPSWFKWCFRARNGKTIRNAIALKSDQRRGPFLHPPKPLRVLYVGRFVFQKRIEVLLEALAILRERGVPLSLDLYGQGTAKYEDKLSRLSNSLGLEKYTKFNGYNDHWQRDCSQYDVLVLPSITEGMPNVLVEAMALGLPVIASDIPEISCFVRNGEDACLFRSDDARALAETLFSAQDSSEVLNRYQLAGKALAAGFTLERMVSSYEEMYHTLFNQIRIQGPKDE